MANRLLQDPTLRGVIRRCEGFDHAACWIIGESPVIVLLTVFEGECREVRPVGVPSW
jgi:hypothetical protein